VNSFH